MPLYQTLRAPSRRSTVGDIFRRQVATRTPAVYFTYPSSASVSYIIIRLTNIFSAFYLHVLLRIHLILLPRLFIALRRTWTCLNY